MAKKLKLELAQEPELEATENLEEVAKPALVPEPEPITEAPESEEAVSIAKPDASRSLDRFKVKDDCDGLSVGELPQALKVLKLAEAKDYIRVSPKPEHWSTALYLVRVPIIGGGKETTLHLIDEKLAKIHLEPVEVEQFRLVVATRPYDRFFLAMVPTQNLDNEWNESALDGCKKAKTLWVKVISRRREGAEGYIAKPARNQKAFPETKWPPQSVWELIEVSFGNGRMIDRDDHPALLRLVGDIQDAE